MALTLGLAAAAEPVFETGALQMRKLGGAKADVAALILGGAESGSLRVAALALPRCPEAGDETPDLGSEVDLLVEIEGAAFLDAVGQFTESDTLPTSARIELYAYVMTESGEIVASLSQWVRVPLATLAAGLPAGGVKLEASFLLQAGIYQIRLLVREASSQQFALKILSVSVANPHAVAPTLAPPRFRDRGQGWLRVGRLGSGLPDAAAGAWSDPPAALPVLAGGSTAAFSVDGCRLNGTVLAARLLDRERRSLVEIPVAAPPERRTDRRVEASLALPEIEAGFYLLELSAETREDRTVTSLPLVLVEPEQADSLATWTAIRGLTAEPERSPAVDPADRARSVSRAEAAADGYLRALDLLARGRLEQAAATLAELEQATVAASTKPQRALKGLTEGQNRVTRELLRHDPECLLPLLVLHLELQGHYRATESVGMQLLHATRFRVRSLAQVYAAQARSEMASALAAMSLAEVAKALQKSGRVLSALVVLREAIALDRENADVLLALAYQYERHGMRREAVDLLRRLLEIEPTSDEGRLRLAMNLRHLERQKEADRLLEQLVTSGSEEWVLAVAYQELASSLTRQERVEEAARLLEEAVTRMPQVQRLYVELAYLLDRSGRRRQGRELIARMPPDSGRPSPRLRYRVRSPSLDSRPRSALIRHGTARLPQLAAALAGGPAVR